MPDCCTEAGRLGHIEASIKALEKMLFLQHEVDREVVAIKNEQLEKRLDGMNEFRAALTDREASYLTRREHEISSGFTDERLSHIDSDLRVLRESKAELHGKASQSSMTITLILAVFSLCVSLLGILLRFFGEH
jgi:hypothetical protein